MPKTDSWIDDNIKIIEFCGSEWLVFDVDPKLQGGGVDYVVIVNNKHGHKPQEIKGVEFSVITHSWNKTVIVDCKGTIFGPHGHGPEATVFLKNTKKLGSTELTNRDEIEDYLRWAKELTAEMILDV